MSNIDTEHHLSLTSHCQRHSSRIRADNRAGLCSTSVVKTQYGRTMCSCALTYVIQFPPFVLCDGYNNSLPKYRGFPQMLPFHKMLKNEPYAGVV